MMIYIFENNLAEIMCRFSREEFQCGMNAIQVDSSTALISKLDRLRSSLDEDPSAFKSFYEFCFEFSKEEGQKSLSLDVAMAIWDIVLVSRFDKMVDWCEFLSSSSSHHPKGITRDTWCLLLDFMQLVEHDYGSYDEASAWPVLVDEVKRNTDIMSTNSSLMKDKPVRVVYGMARSKASKRR